MIKFNIVEDDGTPSSVTVFIGAESLVATKDHPNFTRILDGLRSGETDQQKVRGWFDVGVAISDGFNPLSERVSVSKGGLYFDGDRMDDALTQAILRFYSAGQDDFKPLVNFLEKISVNPNPHSREHLFRWLTGKNIGICPDGDFIAYKGLDRDEHSVHSGTAMVNGKVIQGKIPNLPDTVIEMPRSQVTFDPQQGCSTGLHAGNWHYARDFAQGKVVIVKINPRDVVSVPTDSGDAKLRVCRYRVVRVAQDEDRGVLFVDTLERTAKVVFKPEVQDEPKKPAKKAGAAAKRKGAVTKKPSDVAKAAAKKAAAKKAAPKVEPKLPRYYEEFTKVNFDTLPFEELKWIAKEWGVVVRGTRAALTQRLVVKGRSRRRTW